MHEYFSSVVKSLSIEDVDILGRLISNDATSKAKAIKNSNLFKESDTSEAIYRKVMTRLLTLLMIETNTQFKEHKFYITPFGIEAFYNTIDTMKGDEA